MSLTVSGGAVFHGGEFNELGITAYIGYHNKCIVFTQWDGIELLGINVRLVVSWPAATTCIFAIRGVLGSKVCPFDTKS